MSESAPANRPQKVPHVPFPLAFRVVDVVGYRIIRKGWWLFKRTHIEILMGRKPNQVHLQLPGGFVDPTDASSEEAARREYMEEVAVAITDEMLIETPLHDEKRSYLSPKFREYENKLRYLGSMRVDDVRYRTSCHKIITSIYATQLPVDTVATAGDDLCEVRWVSLKEIIKTIDTKDNFVRDCHIPIMKTFINFYAR